MYQNRKDLLSKIENLVSLGVITPTRRIDLETLVCFTEKTPQGNAWHQYIFEQLPKELAPHFLGRSIGDSFMNFKIVAAFDIWPDQLEDAKPLAKRVDQ